MDINYLHLIWAKTAPFKSILSHSLDTAAVAEALLTNGIFKTILPDLAVWIKKTCSDSSCAEIQNLVLYLASLHDIGKINPFFTGKSDEKGACKLLDSEELIRVHWSCQQLEGPVTHTAFQYDWIGCSS